MANLGGSSVLDFLKSPLVMGIIIAGIILLVAILVGPMILSALNQGVATVGSTNINLPGGLVSR